jgi:hypothetical protein
MEPARCRFGPPVPQACSIVGGRGGRRVNTWHGARSAVPTPAVLVGKADLTPRINRYVGGRLCPPYRPRIVSNAAYDSNFGNAGLPLSVVWSLSINVHAVHCFVNGRLARDGVTL